MEEQKLPSEAATELADRPPVPNADLQADTSTLIHEEGTVQEEEAAPVSAEMTPAPVGQNSTDIQENATPQAEVSPIPTVTMPIYIQTTASTAKRKKPLLFVLGGIFSVILFVVLALVLTKPGRTVKRAQELSLLGEYGNALVLLSELDSSKARLAEKEVYSQVEEELESYLEDAHYEKARKILEELPDTSECDELKEMLYDSIEDGISALMDAGDYIAAQKLLDESEELPNFALLQEQIKYESLILNCAFDLRPHLNNPASLQINWVEIYPGDSDDKYPALVYFYSGQNGFGGTSAKYGVSSRADATHLGGTESLDTDDLDDYSEMLVAILINAYREESELSVFFNLNRVNTLLAAGNMPKIDITQYASKTVSPNT